MSERAVVLAAEQQPGLVRYQAMCKAIADCHSVDEVKGLRDKAKALEVYAQQAQNFEAERKACEIRIRAERRAGVLLKGMKQCGQRHNGRGNNQPKLESPCTTSTPQLSDLGITRDQSSKWQQLANVPTEEFERAVNSDGPKPSTDGIINAHILRQNPQPRMDADALWLWGRLRDFERNGILKRKPRELLATMTDSMRDDCLRILPRVIAWLGQIKGV